MMSGEVRTFSQKIRIIRRCKNVKSLIIKCFLTSIVSSKMTQNSLNVT